MISESVTRLLEQRKLAASPFPASSLLLLYFKSRPEDTYTNYFEGLKLLAAWLAPIDTAELATKYHEQKVFYPLYTYEMQEVAVILDVHPSIIQQFFLGFYHDRNASNR